MRPILALVTASVLASPAEAAQEQPAPDPDIVVEAERPVSEDEAKALARQVGANIDLLRPLARFDDSLCLDVSGLNDEYQTRFATRVKENALRAGMRIASDGCRPNAMVMFAENSRDQLLTLRKRNRFLFGEMPRYAFKEMLASRDRVYAWQINEVTGLGTPFDANSQFGNGPPVNRTLEVGRLNPPIRMVTRSSVVVIEKSQTEAKTPEQLADYATMRLVAPTAEIPVDAAGPPTIMTLFADPASAPAGLTTFDMAYLESVYKVRPNGPSGQIFVETAKAIAAADRESDKTP